MWAVFIMWSFYCLKDWSHFERIESPLSSSAETFTESTSTTTDSSWTEREPARWFSDQLRHPMSRQAQQLIRHQQRHPLTNWFVINRAETTNESIRTTTDSSRFPSTSHYFWNGRRWIDLGITQFSVWFCVIILTSFPTGNFRNCSWYNFWC